MSLASNRQPSGFRRSRVLITGGLGFIGSNLSIRLRQEGADVTFVDSMIPEDGGNLHNVQPVRDPVGSISRACATSIH
jgi:nucleoside-diphosphate-sugar epimerase